MSQEKTNASPSAHAASSTPGDPSAAQLPKAYDPSAIEQRWADFWVRERLFEVPEPKEVPEPTAQAPKRAADQSSGAPFTRSVGGVNTSAPFTILLPPPNVTGRLHMGHMLNQTEMDILTRWHRMLGETALWVPGTDHAGIATQMMVERQLASEGSSRKALGREAFTERVWQWKHQYGSAITDQMRRLGASVDWSREYFTMDDRLSVAVKEAFIRLYEQGLIYRGSYIVNWDPIQQTAVSDLEVTHEERLGKLYHIRYPFADGPLPDGTASLTIATTRPETMLGDVAVAVNPTDPRYAHLLGKVLALPLSRTDSSPARSIPILADDWANPEFGTGAVKVTPAHDPNDFAIGQRHNLPSLTVMDESAHIHLPGSPYHGLDRFAARERIVADLEAAGLLVAVKDHAHAIGVSQRSGAVIEPRLSMQWFLAVNKPVPDGSRGTRPSIAQTAIDAVREGHITFTPDMYAKTYFEWMGNIHDWCISRQLWWGHRIPAWHCNACGRITVAREPVHACSGCGITDIRQETDVLDTWFSSGLLPFTVFGWPGTQEPQYFETIRETAEGEGKYIRQMGGGGNYAHVQLRISPTEAGKGFAFFNETGAQTLPEKFIQPIREGIREAMRGGVVAGHPLVDLKVSLIDGSFHETDSNEMAFSIAASIAFKEAARQAKPTLLEPRASSLTPGLATFYPTSLLVTGFDILFFWVARMIMLGTHFMLDVPIADESGGARPRTLAEAVPFKAVYIHALVRDANREKMSKTKGNVIDPIEIVTKYGTDAVRFTLASQASPGTDIAFSEARTEGYRAFANKIWNAARFLFMNLDRAREAGIPFDLPTTSATPTTSGTPTKPGAPSSPSFRVGSTDLDPIAVDHSILGKLASLIAASTPHGEAVLQTGNIDLANQSATSEPAVPNTDVSFRPDPELAEGEAEKPASQAATAAAQPLEARWILTRLSQTTAAVNASLTDYRFDEAASHVYQFFWGDLCDWYLEIVKLRLNFDTPAQHAETSAALTTLVRVFESALRLLSPFMPFLTEEIWHALYAGTPPAKSIALARYPQPADYPADPASITAMETLQELITSTRALRKELAVPEKEFTPIRVHAPAHTATIIHANAEYLTRLARVTDVQFAESTLTGAGSRSTPAFDVQVLYERQIDIPAERERLTKELAKLSKTLTANETRLADPTFLGKAPAHIVEGLRKQTDEVRTLRDKAQSALDALPPA